jgi:septal ring factor EnvC (AmiA/AmiB activator)
MNKQEERETLDRFLNSLPTHSYLQSVCYGLRDHLEQQMAVDHAEPWVTTLQYLDKQITEAQQTLTDIEEQTCKALTRIAECERQEARLQREIAESRNMIDELVTGLRRV